MLKNFIAEFEYAGLIKWICIIFNIFYLIINIWTGGILLDCILNSIISIHINVLVPLIIIILLPLLYFGLFLNKGIRSSSEKVIHLTLGIEVPIYFLCILRLMAIKELLPFYVLVLSSLFLCICVYLAELLGKKFDTEKEKVFAVFSYETLVIIGGYLCLLLLFFAIPFGIVFLKGIFSTDFLLGIFQVIKFIFSPDFFLNFFTSILILSILCFLFMIMILFILTPIISTVLYIQKFDEKRKELNKPSYIKIFALVYIIFAVLLIRQPSNIKAENYINQVKNTVSYEQQAETALQILPYTNKINRALLDNYLIRFRYMSDENGMVIKEMYEETFASVKFAKLMQNIFNKAAYPFIYQGKARPDTVNKDYKRLYDEDIQFANKKAVSKAASSTLFNTEENATLLDIDKKAVHVDSRIIEIETIADSPVVKVAFNETYLNKTKRDKEVYYEFSLPENAVMTYLGMGETYLIDGKLSPKGAARKTYKSQVVNFQDPALLEKSGIRQYNLRAYPIVPKIKQKVRMDYVTIASNGEIELPSISQIRNAYTDKDSQTKVLVNGVEREYSDKIQVGLTKFVSPQYMVFEGNYFYLVPKKQVFDINSVKGVKAAFLLDTSYSNKTIWKEYFAKNINDVTFLKNNKVDFYFFNNFISEKIIDINSAKQINFGPTARTDAYNSLKEKYDFVIMLTDSSVFDDSAAKTAKISSPLYVIHTGNKVPSYSNLLTDAVYKSNGGIADTVTAAVEKYYYMRDKKIISVDADYYVIKSSVPIASLNAVKVADDNLKQIMVSKILENKIRTGDTKNISILDDIYKTAKQYGIVTNYSSYIVLVTKNQRKLLEANEKSDDRFEADYETGRDERVNRINVNSTPEPKDWMLIFTGILLMLLYCLKDKWKWIRLKR